MTITEVKEITEKYRLKRFQELKDALHEIREQQLEGTTVELHVFHNLQTNRLYVSIQAIRPEINSLVEQAISTCPTCYCTTIHENKEFAQLQYVIEYDPNLDKELQKELNDDA